MGQRKIQKGYKNIFKQIKMEIQHTKWMGFNKSSSKRKVYSDNWLYRERFQVNNLTLHLKKLEK